MTVFVQLETLTSGQPFRRGRTQPTTSADYWRIVDAADNLDWYWSGLTSPDGENRKLVWWEQFALNRNKLVISDYSACMARGNHLFTRNLELARLWAVLGGQSTWIDAAQWEDASGTDSQWLCRVVVNALDALTPKSAKANRA